MLWLIELEDEKTSPLFRVSFCLQCFFMVFLAGLLINGFFWLVLLVNGFSGCLVRFFYFSDFSGLFQ